MQIVGAKLRRRQCSTSMRGIADQLDLLIKAVAATPQKPRSWRDHAAARGGRDPEDPRAMHGTAGVAYTEVGRSHSGPIPVPWPGCFR
jgi:hypothetical protein